jgi:hypothetical protein
MEALAEEDAVVVLLFMLVTALEPEAAASPTMREVWSVSPTMLQWKLVWCSEQ